jgi:serpin B
MDERVRQALRSSPDGGALDGDLGQVRGRARRRKRRVRAALITGVAVVVAAVTTTAVVATRPDAEPTRVTAGPGEVVLPANAQIAVSHAPRATPDQTHVPALVAGNTRFAFDLFHELVREQPDENLCFSPNSISTALAMVYAGARGDTASEIAKAYHFDLPADQLHAAFNALDQLLEAPHEFELVTTNAVWGQRGFPFVQAYLDLLARDYGAGLRLADFERAAEQERVKINRYVEQQTTGKIKDLFAPGVVDATTRLVLVNTIYFKGEWVQPFLPGWTEPHPFHRLDTSTVDVPTMYQHGAELAIARPASLHLQAIKLPYVGGASMEVIVPDDGHFADVQRGLGADLLRAIAEEQRTGTVDLYLPRFSFRSSFTLHETLQHLGVHHAFDDADFAGIAPNAGLALSDVVHQATVAVDEEGTEAAAATGASIATAGYQEIRVDRPFLFVITDDATGAVLFAGRVLDPTGT